MVIAFCNLHYLFIINCEAMTSSGYDISKNLTGHNNKGKDEQSAMFCLDVF